MSFVEQTIIQLIVAVVAFLAGFFLQRIRAILAYLRARRFWRPLLKRDLALILGDGFLDMQSFEASNVVGRGDLLASYELTSYFSRIGFRRLQPTFADRVVGTDLSGRELRRNLVILGGPDANRICLSCIKGMDLSYALEWQEPSATSTGSPSVTRRPLPRFVSNGLKQEVNQIFEPSSEGGEIVRDYGILIRSRNPFISVGTKPARPWRGRRVAIIYGCYGYGTLAAALYSQTAEFLDMIENESDDVECIVTCRVIEGTPQAPECVFFKRHSYGTLAKTLNINEARKDM